ncbi:MAG TPA: YdcF family protein [Rhodocyclaceae bacterium]|nr:YdcF family protein [Rhodocyclaceae bacterium]
MFLVKKLLTALILPPTSLIFIALCGLGLMQCKSRRWRDGGALLTLISLLGLLTLSLPIVGNALLAQHEIHPVVGPQALERAQAIVVLGGGSYFAAPEYGGDTVNRTTLERLRYAAQLARRSQLPLLVTGGAPYGGRSEAESMQETLEREFAVPVRWVENAARDTEENAAYSAARLKAAGIERIVLVSHGWHLRRATPLFVRQGLQVAPAPTGFSTLPPLGLAQCLPSASGLSASQTAIQEHLGLWYYRLKGKV